VRRRRQWRCSSRFVLAGSSHRAARNPPADDAKISSIQPASYSIAETRVLDASKVSPTIEGRPNIDNVQFLDANPHDGQIGLSFDITSHVTSMAPARKSMIRLLSYVLESDDSR